MSIYSSNSYRSLGFSSSGVQADKEPEATSTPQTPQSVPFNQSAASLRNYSNTGSENSDNRDTDVEQGPSVGVGDGFGGLGNVDKSTSSMGSKAFDALTSVAMGIPGVAPVAMAAKLGKGIYDVFDKPFDYTNGGFNPDARKDDGTGFDLADYEGPEVETPNDDNTSLGGWSDPDPTGMGNSPENPSSQQGAKDTAGGQMGNSPEMASNKDGAGDAAGGNERVICTELVSQGLMSKEHRFRDLRFTRARLSDVHVRGYHVWAIPVVRLMRKHKLVAKFWRFVAQHRANEIAYILGGRPKPDYIGKLIRLTFEPFCFLVGCCVSEKRHQEIWNTFRSDK